MIIEIKRLFRIYALLSLLLFFQISLVFAFSESEVVEIVESNDSRIVFELKLFEVGFIEKSHEGQRFESPQIEGYQWLTEPGKPQLPMKGILIGIPENANPTIQILESRVTFFSSKNIFPSPTIELNQETQESYLVEQFYIDSDFYAQNSLYPPNLVEITSRGRIRNQRVCRVEFHPFQYNPVTKQLLKVEKLKISVNFNNEQSPAAAIGSRQISKGAPFESLYKNLLVNYDVAQKWRQSKSKGEVIFDQAREWYDPNFTYYKIYIAEDGIYRLDYSYLLNSGIEGGSINPQTIKIYNKGEEIPLFVSGQEDGFFDPVDYIEFYGRRNWGDTTYFDPYSDTNVYWLTWGGEPGLRMKIKNSAIADAVEINDYVNRVHIEQDNVYHHGDNSLDTIEIEDVEGEGWVWRFFFAGDKETVTIPLNSIAESDHPFKLKIKLRGTTLDPVRPNHHVNIFLNDVLLGDFYFNGTSVYIFDVLFSSLKEGENKLVVQSVGDTGAQIDQIYLDWIELEYPRQLVAQDNYLEFTISESNNEIGRFPIWGFNNKKIEVFDLTTQSIIVGERVEIGERFIFKVVSAGNADGNFSRFYVNSQQISVSGDRGHNLVVLDEVTGQVVETRNFDTHLSTSESDNMAQYLQQLPQDRIVLAAIRDEGSRFMTENAYLALESLGSQLTRNVGYRDSWAMVGIKGARKGTVAEEWKESGLGMATAKDTLALAGSGNLYHTVFSDTLSQAKTYVAVSENAVKYPAHVKLDTTANLRSSQLGADLLIISHNKFLSSANRLAEYRVSQNGLRVHVANVEDIYDEFSYGIVTPLAIKDFLKYTYNYWQSPAPSYVIFFGDASWDFKKNTGENAKENYVPSYGNPVSDNWFVCFDGNDDFLPEMFVGRIPVESAEQAKMVVDKIVTYESRGTGYWKKNILFITGGFNSSEQRTFMSQSNFLIQNYVNQPPANCRPYQINKTTEGYFEGEKKEEVLAAIDQGMMWVNFLGHAGSRTWDLMFNHPDIEELSNEDKYPFITSMTCHTGRFANPELNSFGEHFLVTENKGAIAFWGTSGWGYVFQDNILLKNLFRSVLVDTIHALGEATTLAKLKLWQDYGGGIYNVSTIHQYALLGDPVTDLTLPERPDLTLGAQDVTFSPASPSEADSTIHINVKIQNWGLATQDSFKIDVYDIQDNQTEIIASDFPVPPVGLVDSVRVNWRVADEAGNHVVRVELDGENKIEEVEENNNSFEYPIFIYSSKISISKPYEFQVVSPQSVTLQVNNPAIPSAEESPRYYQFEVDTTVSFDGPLLISSPQVLEGIIVTKWNISDLLNEATYFWRCRTIEGSEIGNWVESSFSTKLETPENSWMQKHRAQFARNDFHQTEFSSRGIQIETRKFVLQAESAGFFDGSYARILVNSTPVLEQHRGHNIVVVKANTGDVIAQKSFDTWASQDEANAMAVFINNIENGAYVLCAIRDDGSFNMTETGYQALESIGSQYCRDVGFRDSWAIIGVKGASIGTVKEKLTPASQGIAVAQDTLLNYYKNGTIASPPVGPADGWNYVSWREDVSLPETNITLDVIGYNKKVSQWDTLITGFLKNAKADISHISAKTYPLIKLKANLTDADGFNTPFLHDWSVAYEPVADPAIGFKVVSLDKDSLMEGDILNFNVSVHNVGMKIVDSVKLRFAVNTADSGKIKLFEDRVLTNVPIDSFRSFSQVWIPAGSPGRKQVFIETDPDDQINELSESNNYYAANIYVLSDTVKPSLIITYDGKTIVSGDFVSDQPDILINVFDNSQISVENDSTKIDLFVDNERLKYSGNESTLKILPVNDPEEPQLRTQVRYTPQFTDGDHSLEIFVKDARNNFIYHRDDFQVTSEFKILNVFNFPNPFSDGTEFTFNLTQPSERLTIKIYTVAGRLIRTLECHHLEAGFHHIYWNGLDQDRDVLANGVYLYKTVARNGDKQIERIDKMVVMR